MKRNQYNSFRIHPPFLLLLVKATVPPIVFPCCASPLWLLRLCPSFPSSEMAINLDEMPFPTGYAPNLSFCALNPVGKGIV